MIDIKARQKLMQQQFLKKQGQEIATALSKTLPEAIKPPVIPPFPSITIPDNKEMFQQMVQKLDELLKTQKESNEEQPVVIPDNQEWYKKIVERLDAMLVQKQMEEMDEEEEDSKEEDDEEEGPKEVFVTNLPQLQNQEEIVRGLGAIERQVISLQNALVTLPTGASGNREDRKLLKGILDELKGVKNGLETIPQPVMPSNDEMVEKLDTVNETLKALAELQASQANYVPPTVTNVSINALNGEMKTQAITVTSTITAIPTNALANRRTLIFYNNSNQNVELGGSTLTYGQGLPILPGTYSPPLDAGARLPIYAIVASGTADVRVGEISDQNTGR